MKKTAFFALFPAFLTAQEPAHTAEHIEHTAQPISAPQQLQQDNHTVTVFHEQALRSDKALTEKLLNTAIFQRQLTNIEKLAEIYQDFSVIDSTLLQYAQGKIALLKGKYSQAIADFRTILATRPDLNTVRIELAIALLQDQQINAASEQFEKAKSAENLPSTVKQLIERYQTQLTKKQKWQFSVSGHYVRDTNINNTSKQPEIENTGYIKQPNLLPQTAHGIHYQFGIQRDFNLSGSHYFSLNHDTEGELYWDNHRYDEITSRTLLGYAYKKSQQTFRLLPFYEKRWQHHSAEHWKNGLRLEYSHWLSPKWQIATAVEYGKKRYFDQHIYNGKYYLASTTLLWLRSPQQHFFAGLDFNQDKTRLKQHGSETKGIRLGWQQEWQALKLSSRLTVAYTDRQYKDVAILGNRLNLGKIRHDTITSTVLTLWKRDWHWHGLTPKLQFSHNNHRSNLPTLYAYIDNNVNLILESRF